MQIVTVWSYHNKVKNKNKNLHSRTSSKIAERGHWTLDKTEGTIKNKQSRETGNIGYTKHNTWQTKLNGHHSAQTKTNNVHKINLQCVKENGKLLFISKNVIKKLTILSTLHGHQLRH